MQQMFEWSTPQECRLFLHMYEELSRGYDTFYSDGYGTDPHLEQTWALLQHNKRWQLKGTKVKLCRWYSWMDRAAIHETQ